jgi:hypothetical protein
MKILIFTILLTLSVTFVDAQNSNWFEKFRQLHKSTPTVSTLERIFGSPRIIYSTPLEEIQASKSKTKVIEYELTDGKLHVFYSGGKCSSENTEDWDLEEGVIISYYFSAKNLLPLKQLKINLKQFPVTKANDTAHLFYRDEKKGITYTVLGDKLQYLEFRIPNLESLNCKKNS